MSRDFAGYARAYDLIYQDKDYAGEAAYVGRLLRRFHPAAKTLIEFGSGTGRHALHLARQGYKVCGVDRSEEMLARAKARRAALSSGSRRVMRFVRGDIRGVRLARRFDAALALFHVMSYQAADEDLRAAFLTARRHVREGGLFIFDAWHGPAVLAQRPGVRIKRVRDGRMEVLRRAQPVLFPDRDAVEVKYQLRIKWKTTGKREEVRETHLMRYVFAPEIARLAQDCGFKVLSAVEWLTGRPLGRRVWSACFVLRRLGAGIDAGI
ncbi:MAG TPA: SAM-dependent methyltransferase [Elusimicrobia bacterium]|nr:SAM-dependent methyltransferase [Elusimicrobiota bacterium]